MILLSHPLFWRLLADFDKYQDFFSERKIICATTTARLLRCVCVGSIGTTGSNCLYGVDTLNTCCEDVVVNT